MKLAEKLKYLIWEDRIVTISDCGDWYLQRSLLGWLRHRCKNIWNSNHWFVTGTFSACCAVGATLVTNQITAKNNDAAEGSKENNLHARVVLLECSPQAGDLLLCKKPVNADKNSIAGANQDTVGNRDAHQQLASKP
ncbi:hypothetical protein J8I87_06145 [Paraburkholderia sp. LEh10]|uniref:hypothetical protein n=1 Tax=Paraburkholderia sp. LEh10 TaxID=2821353 RepID=UPI001AE14B6A|nr:hypothetical protein [Paraburkholderia sp. LEh10]MBP0589305.1 hypothetical protein [Paraburkholderia sp. LEh10]